MYLLGSSFIVHVLIFQNTKEGGKRLFEKIRGWFLFASSFKKNVNVINLPICVGVYSTIVMYF